MIMNEIATIFHTSLETPITLTDEFVQLLIIENPHEFYKFVDMFDCSIKGEESELSFLRNGKPIYPDREGCIICDPFHFDLNDKKVINLLFKNLAELCKYGETQLELSTVNTDIGILFAELFESLPFSLTYSELTVEELLKSADVHFEKIYDTLLEKIICYINVMTELKHCGFFVFVNLKSVLCDEELASLYHHCALEKVGLLLIEYGKCRPLSSEEKAIIITEDLCEILENYG